MPRLIRILALFVVIIGCSACASVETAPQTPPIVIDRVAPFKNTSLHYIDAGKSELPLIFIHGWAGQSGIWRNQIEDLSRDHRVIAIDLPGHGASGRLAEPYTQQTFAAAVLSVMDHAQVNHAILVGHSMGASVIRHVALTAPQRVSGLILVDGAFLFPPEDKMERQKWMKEMKAFTKNFKGPKSEAFTESFINSMHGRTTPDWAKDEVLARVMTTPKDIRFSAMKNFTNISAWPKKTITLPTLGLYVRSEETGPEFETNLKTLFPALELTLWDGPGHFYMLYEAARLNEQIRLFVQKRKVQ